VVETVAELTILAISHVFGCFFLYEEFCLLPDATTATIEKIYEVEEAIYQER
jgi:hypothetical protein